MKLVLAALIATVAAPVARAEEPQSESGRGLTMPVIVSLGGWNGCKNAGPDDGVIFYYNQGDALSAYASQLVAENIRRARGEDADVGEALRPRWVKGCFDSLSYFHFWSGRHPEERVTTIMDMSPLALAIQEEAGNGGDHPVYAFGHSYGGWAALRALAGMPAAIKVAQVVTIDPISPDKCSIGTYISTMGGAEQSLEGCQKAPDDISGGIRRYLLSRMPPGRWHHYYQTNFSLLHSSEFTTPPGPGISSDMTDELWDSWIAHISIARSSVIWSDLRETLRSDYE
jgi:pimeloyl-ACP methyl ester carboxylesterase